MRRFFALRNAPVWLPVAVLIRDFLAWQCIFFHEPGISYRDVVIGKLFMLPGTLFGAGALSPLTINLASAFCIGVVLYCLDRLLKRKKA